MPGVAHVTIVKPTGYSRRGELWTHPDMVLLFAIVQVMMGFVASAPSNLLGMALALFIVWSARPSYLPALLINQLSAANFNLMGIEGSATAANLSGYALAFAVFLRVTWELKANPMTFSRWRWALGAWYVAMFPALVMGVMALVEGNPSWTLPLRTVWLTGGLFFGLILARRWPVEGRLLHRRFFHVMTALLVLFFFGICDHKLKFVLLPLAFPVAVLVWRRGGKWQRILAVVSVNFAGLIGIGVGMGGEDLDLSGNMGVGGATLSLNGLFIGSIVLALVLMFNAATTRRIVSWSFGLPAFVTIVTFSIIVAVIGPDRTLNGDTHGRRLTLQERVRMKVFNDRSMIWNAALMDAVHAPYVFKPAGVSLWIDYAANNSVEWKFGAHNSVINILSSQRWLNGLILLGLLGCVMHRTSSVASMKGFSEAHALGVFAFMTSTVGVMVNDYPTNDEASFWFYGLSAIAIGLVDKAREPMRKQSPRHGVVQQAVVSPR